MKKWPSMVFRKEFGEQGTCFLRHKKGFFVQWECWKQNKKKRNGIWLIIEVIIYTVVSFLQKSGYSLKFRRIPLGIPFWV